MPGAPKSKEHAGRGSGKRGGGRGGAERSKNGESCGHGSQGRIQMTSDRRVAHVYMKVYIVRMSSKYSVAEARANLPKILDQVELGRAIELTRRGKRIAVLMSVEEYERLSGGQRDFAEAYEAHREKYDGVERKAFEDLRDQSQGRSVRL